MPTATRTHRQLTAGDVIIAQDGAPAGPVTVEGARRSDGALRLVHDSPNGVEWWLYPDQADTWTVERPETSTAAAVVDQTEHARQEWAVWDLRANDWHPDVEPGPRMTPVVEELARRLAAAAPAPAPDEHPQVCPGCRNIGWHRPDGTHYKNALAAASARRRSVSKAKAAVSCKQCHRGW